MKTLPLNTKKLHQKINIYCNLKIHHCRNIFEENINNLNQINCFQMKAINGEIQKYLLKKKIL